MIRFIDLRYQGTQHRFAFWDTSYDVFAEFSGFVAWEDWNDFEADVRADLGTRINDIGRYASLCPPWVHQPATDEELEFKDGDEHRHSIHQRVREAIDCLTYNAGVHIGVPTHPCMPMVANRQQLMIALDEIFLGKGAG